MERARELQVLEVQGPHRELRAGLARGRDGLLDVLARDAERQVDGAGGDERQLRGVRRHLPRRPEAGLHGARRRGARLEQAARAERLLRVRGRRDRRRLPRVHAQPHAARQALADRRGEHVDRRRRRRQLQGPRRVHVVVVLGHARQLAPEVDVVVRPLRAHRVHRRGLRGEHRRVRDDGRRREQVVPHQRVGLPARQDRR